MALRSAAFRVYLPRAVGEASLHKKADPAMDPSHEPLRPARILLVEDHPAVRRSARRALEQCGHSVVEVERAEDALDVLERQGDFELVLSDVIMPGMSGVALAARLAERRPQLQVLLMSGFGGDKLGGRDGLPHGASFIEKPFSTEELCRKVREILQGGAGDGA